MTGSPHSYDSSSHSLLSSSSTERLVKAPYPFSPPGKKGDSNSYAAIGSTPTSSSSKQFSSISSGLPLHLWRDDEPDFDDAFYKPDAKEQPFTLWSSRGWANIGFLVFLFFGILTLFAGWPIFSFMTVTKITTAGGFGLGGINATGQISEIPGASLIDSDTPANVRTRIGTDGKKYNLVYSDEFNTDGRTFWPGDDPYWEAQDFHYWATGDIEWYDPEAIRTRDGKLEITLTQQRNHDLDFRSGMLTSWNKFCFTTGYVEVSLSLPGQNDEAGLWPGVWTMGNLGRAGYGATTDGLWPYSYDTCDTGTFPNQTSKTGVPSGLGTKDNNGVPQDISYLPGQRLSACSCPGSEHPGPDYTKARGVPEIDIIEAQINTTIWRGEMSQSYQIAPFTPEYDFPVTAPAAEISDPAMTRFNVFKGSPLQQSLSAVSLVTNDVYDGKAYTTYGYEYWSDPNNREDGFIQWFNQGKPSWRLTPSVARPNVVADVGQRLISEEPMYMIFNLGMSPGFQPQDFKNLKFPATMRIDYVRVYQRDGLKDALTCDPKSHPTHDYIQSHKDAYFNENRTTWKEAGYDWPKNKLYEGGC